MSIKENNRSMLPAVFGTINISFKTWILIAICLQNAGYSLTRKYSVQYEKVSSKEILIGLNNKLRFLISRFYSFSLDFISFQYMKTFILLLKKLFLLFPYLSSILQSYVMVSFLFLFSTPSFRVD